jgi:hypothetical protein
MDPWTAFSHVRGDSQAFRESGREKTDLRKWKTKKDTVQYSVGFIRERPCMMVKVAVELSFLGRVVGSLFSTSAVLRSMDLEEGRGGRALQ